MAQTRNTPCRYYICENNCEKGFEGTFGKACQKCKNYIPIIQKKPVKTRGDLRKTKRSDYEEKEAKEMLEEEMERYK